MAQDTIVGNLTSLGLTKNEAKAYHTLVKLGRSAARVIAEDSGIPRSKVYETLEILEKRGIIKKVQGTNPTEFDPAPVDAALDHLEEKVKSSATSARNVLKGLQDLRGTEAKEFAWTNQGMEQVIMGMRTAIENAQEYVYIASASPRLLGHLRGAFSNAKSRGVVIELYTTTPGTMEIAGLDHYLKVKISSPSKDILTESFIEVFQSPDLSSDEWEPARMLIMNVDGKESVGVFLPGDESSQPWALHIRSRLVVLIQWQVVKTVLSNVEAIIRSKMS
ncbi:MAG: TrmB family transcriptional regulator [Candidatus Thorarchaeota archaeon]|nr:TrmB family transcriptional regulator [Candidatus Thorarchaeota archaeon]